MASFDPVVPGATTPKTMADSSWLSFTVWDTEEDRMYTGMLEKGHAKYEDASCGRTESHEVIRDTMDMVPDEAIFPKLPDNGERFPVAPELCAGPNLFIKRTSPPLHFASHNWNSNLGYGVTLPDLMLHEARMFNLVSQHPQHPNIVRYHGCRVRRGFITGLVLDRVPFNTLLERSAVGGIKDIDKGPFMAALESAVDHLHRVVGIAHNDIQPQNIMIGPAGTPVLIDLNWAGKIGHRNLLPGGIPLWQDEKRNPRVSQKRHDLYSLAKIRWWLDHPDELTHSMHVFPVRIRLETDPAEPDNPDMGSPTSRPRVPGSKLPDPDQDMLHLDT
ncbi:hypothetical protein B0T25DRAFT_566200 [Lasiosphaeria hispida]|uniref:Protein kinase domain-containing protein n=1 Tax=Lasiosphaeria hispida TaxID=260671 RepID=A0AAJ0HLP3_9PEZI|nr:hypothetical protein B0T25DRAFT_566200 [Lasiosphaeria hispida]